MNKQLLITAMLIFTVLCLCSCKSKNADIPEQSVTEDTTRQAETAVTSDISADNPVPSELNTDSGIEAAENQDNSETADGSVIFDDSGTPSNINTDPHTEAYDEKVTLLLPEASKTVRIDSEKIGTVYTDKTNLLEKIGKVWYSWSDGYNSVPELYDDKADKLIDLDFPENFPGWYAGSGLTVTLADRYVYEWLGYNDNTVKLTRVDTKEHKLEVIRSVPSSDSFIAFINLSKIDDEKFLSFYRYSAPDEDLYDIYSVCEIYDIDGNYREILREGLKYDPDTDRFSEGYFYDAFTAKDGEIYSLGKEIIGGEPKWSLKRFSDNGEALETVMLNNFGYMAGTESVEAFNIAGDYLVTRDDARTTCYVYKINGGSDAVVVKGIKNLYYTATDNLIIVAVSADEEGNALSYCDFNVINAESGETVEYTFDLDDGLDSKDLRKILVTADGNLQFTFDYNSKYIIKTIPVELLNKA